jgi:SAM-dependent methyltransferase
MKRRDFLLSVLACALTEGCGRAVEVPDVGVRGELGSRFHAVYGDEATRERFKDFLVHVFHLYPEDRFHDLIRKCTLENPSDEAIYRALLAGLPSISPAGRQVTYGLPALKKQKKVMAEQVASLLGPDARIDGYVEMGTTGRYLNTLRDRMTVEGPTFVLNDLAPTNSPVDVLERGQLAKAGTFVHLAQYQPLGSEIADASVGVVSNLIGFHHCPPEALGDFVSSLRRVLRPGGHLLVREHDVDAPEMDTFVALAHDVFNAGVGIGWEDNARQLRHFRSVSSWSEWIEAQGFKVLARTEVQAGDPTDNTLLCFEKV